MTVPPAGALARALAYIPDPTLSPATPASSLAGEARPNLTGLYWGRSPTVDALSRADPQIHRASMAPEG